MVGWSTDDHSLYVSESEGLRIDIFRLDFSSGQKTLWKQITSSDPLGLENIFALMMTRDSQNYVYSYSRTLSDLYLAESLK